MGEGEAFYQNERLPGHVAMERAGNCKFTGALHRMCLQQRLLDVHASRMRRTVFDQHRATGALHRRCGGG